MGAEPRGRDAFLADVDSGQPSPTAAVTYLAVAASTGVLDAAATLCGVHGLQGFDAIQLASAMRARAVDATLTELVTYDVALHRAAAAEGFLVNPLN
jgi:hypothetical protein